MKRLAATSRGSLRSTNRSLALCNQGTKTRSSQPWNMVPSICICDAANFRIGRQDGTVVKDGKCDTTRAELTRVFGGRARIRVLLESSTEREWVAQHLESLGHARV